jgi:hypothetical protein
MRQLMVICTVVVALGAPVPVPVTVTANVPRALFFPVVMVKVDEGPVPGTLVGLNDAVVRAGTPLADSVTAPLNPPERVIPIV